MGKAAKGSNAKDSKLKAKAGKRSGQTVYPEPISVERRAAKDQGEQQFIAKQQLTAVVSVPVLKELVWDKALRGAVIRPKTVTVPTDYTMDASRGRIVSSPKFTEKVGK